MADPIFEIMYKDEHVRVEMDDLTRHRMREIKAALGDDYGIPNMFRLRLASGDYEAIAAVLWIHFQKVGRPIDDMVTLDFCESDFTAVPKVKRPAPKGTRDQTAGTPEQSTTSPEIPTSSATDSSE